MYDLGKIDDNQKNKFWDQLDDTLIPTSKHFMMKCILNFIKMPNDHLLYQQNEEIREL